MGNRLAQATCLQPLRVLLDWPDPKLETWVARQWSAKASDLADSIVRRLGTAQLLRLAELMPEPWAREYGDLVLRALGVSDAQGWSENDRCAEWGSGSTSSSRERASPGAWKRRVG